MRPAKINRCILSILGFSVFTQPLTPETAAHSKRIVIAARSTLDGRGGVLRNTRIVIEGTKIVALDPKAGPVDYDLRGLTVLPGWIDAHVHITWIFGKDGKNVGGGETTQDAAFRTASNAWVTLMGGFTTVQSVGSPSDVPLRDVIAQGLFPGPRILTSVEGFRGEASRRGRRTKSAPTYENRRQRERT